MAVCETLKNAIMQESNAILFVNSDGLEKILKLMDKTENIEILSLILKILNNLATNDDIEKIVVTIGGINATFHCFEFKNHELNKVCCLVLSNFVLNSILIVVVIIYRRKF